MEEHGEREKRKHQELTSTDQPAKQLIRVTHTKTLTQRLETQRFLFFSVFVCVLSVLLCVSCMCFIIRLPHCGSPVMVRWRVFTFAYACLLFLVGWCGLRLYASAQLILKTTVQTKTKATTTTKTRDDVDGVHKLYPCERADTLRMPVGGRGAGDLRQKKRAYTRKTNRHDGIKNTGASLAKEN